MGFHSIHLGRPISFETMMKSKGSLKEGAPLAAATALGEAGVAKTRPMIAAGNAKAKPASGPAIPMSNKARRDLICSLILMTAPKVPNRVTVGGAGIKNGK